MRYFRHVGSVDVGPALGRLKAMDLDAFDADRDFVVPGLLHKSVFLRVHDNPTLGNWLEDLPVTDGPLLSGWPELYALILDAVACIRASIMGPLIDGAAPIGRAVLSVIEPHGFIQWHTDLGEYAKRHLRFHVPLTTHAGALCYAPGEVVHMPLGSVGWLDTQAAHSSGNWGDTSRTHLLFELRKK